MINKLKQYLIRRKTPIVFEDNLRIMPASSNIGTERGTPIDRYYIKKFLAKNRDCVKGAVLEISESIYSKEFDSGVTSFEILHINRENQNATIIGNLTDLNTLPQDMVDCFICTQTFNFIFDVQAAIEGTRKILKPGGVILGTVAGISQISRFDMERWGDYWRFTDLSIKKLLQQQFSEVEVETYGNILASKAFLDGIVVEDLPNPKLLDKHDDDYQITIAFKAKK